MSFPGSPEFENQASRVANDMNVGNAGEAAAILHNQIMSDPRDAGAFIQRAQSEAPGGRDQILVDRRGNVAVEDKFTGQEVFAGRLPGGFPPIIIDIGGWEWGHLHPQPRPGRDHDGHDHGGRRHF